MTAKRWTLYLALLLVAVLFAAGCKKNEPVHNYTDTPMPPVSAKLTNTKVRDAIVRGCVNQGWTAQETKPGLIRAQLNVRTHSVVVDIPYTTKTYSINYVSSVNLDYKDGTIHPKYNSWIRRLMQAVEMELVKSN